MKNPSSFVANNELQINPAKKSFAKYILLLGLFLSITVNYALAADTLDVSKDFPCTDSLPGGCGPWLTGTNVITLNMVAPNCLIKIRYKYRDCGGVYQYVYTEVIAEGNCTQMEDFSIYHYNVNSMMEMADMIIAEEKNQMQGHPTVPFCNEGFSKKMKIYSAGCGVWVKCSYKVNPNDQPIADIGYSGNCPTTWNNGTSDYIDVWKWQSCGTVCCKREYDICWFYNAARSSNEMRVIRLPGIPLAPCSLQGTFAPWENPSQPYTCQQACDN